MRRQIVSGFGHVAKVDVQALGGMGTVILFEGYRRDRRRSEEVNAA
jgi:hypothetical protein